MAGYRRGNFPAKGSRRFTPAERAAYWKKLYLELKKSRSR